MTSITRFFVVGIFLVVITVPLVGDLFGVARKNGIVENRYLEENGSLSLFRSVGLYIRNFDRKFWGREFLVKAFITIKQDVLHVSPLPEKVVLGKDGWLFLSDYGAMDDYRNARPFSVLQLDSIRTNLKRMADSLRQHQIPLFVVVVPDKHTIYPEFLPPLVQKVRIQSRLQQLTEYLKQETTFRFINLTDTLLNAKNDRLLYFKEESHWNDQGAFVGYHKLMDEITDQFPQLPVLEIDSCSVSEGLERDIDLAKILGESIDYAEPTIKIVPHQTSQIQRQTSDAFVPPAKRFNVDYTFRKINPFVNGYSVIVYRDSFFEGLLPFFEQSFSNTTLVWTNDVDLAYVLQKKPQLVVLEIAERHIDLLAK